MATAGPATRTGRSADSRRQPHRPRRVLGFTDAMRDFQSMFPSMGADVIESVLRSNNGSVDATIDQLISMGGEEDETDNGSVPQVPTDGEGPPGYSPRQSHDDVDPLPSYETVARAQQREPVRNERNQRRVIVKATNLSRTSASGYTAPLVGSLPDDFLRIKLPKPQKYVQKRRTHELPLGYGTAQQSLAAHRRATAVEPNTALQVLEDERIALYIQNEEFLRELRRNREFIDSLENDRRRQVQDHMLLVYPSKNRHPTATVPPHMTRNYMPPQSAPNAAPQSTVGGPRERATQLSRRERYQDNVQEHEVPPASQSNRNEPMQQVTAVDGSPEQSTTLHGLGFEAEMTNSDPPPASVGSDDDRAFKEKLRHMSKSTRKKLHQLARLFSRKKRRQNLSITDASSQANLLGPDESRSELTADAIAEELDSPDEIQFQRSHLRFQISNDGEPQRSDDDDDPICFYSEDYNMALEPSEETADAENEEMNV